MRDHYSPEAEVPFCGHTTIAAGVQLGQLDGPDYRFDTTAVQVAVVVRQADGVSGHGVDLGRPA